MQVLLLGAFGMAGGMKGLAPARAKERLAWAKTRPDRLLRFVGILEILGALGLVLPWATGILPWLTPVAAGGLATVQGLAILTVHGPDQEYRVIPANVIPLLLATLVAWGRWEAFAS